MTNVSGSRESLFVQNSSDATKPAPPALEWWLLLNGFFADAGVKRVSGPYSTQEDAYVARVTIERLRGSNDLWVDSRPASDPKRKVGE